MLTNFFARPRAYSLPRWRCMYWLLCDPRLPKPIQQSLLIGPTIQTSFMWSGTITILLLTLIAVYRNPTPAFWAWCLATLSVSAYRIWLQYLIKRRWDRQHIATPADQAYLANLLWSAVTGLGTALCLLSGDTVLQVLTISSMVALASIAAGFSHGTPRYAMLQVLLLDLPLKLAVPFQPEPWFWVLLLQGPFFWVALHMMTRTLHKMSAQLLLDEYQSRQKAHRDPLTELLNREGWFREALAVRGPGRAPMPAGLLFIDLDGFKRINDTHGHLKGDQLLHQIATLMSDALRADDILARWGGDEFVILLPGADADASRTVAQRLIEITADLGRVHTEFGLSIGLVHCDDWRGANRERIEQLIARADQALYRAKQDGKGQFQEARDV
ncbi:MULTISPECIES: GGDEF domain-containing protein [unclassified Modicisalibacter]|uniref:GGDEF domain-containing protein n=1 Tax=unclassified Modicisalibacter TaxID=2679913 RepID=UPI001CC91D3A|nr:MULTISPECIES: GGDEF domain-containing protein [unclassified Modicisalibacter]MBZ9559533.1 GGDEF domain-containing protein [Modicisalibacter sp. R2A 31.J]MBZ9576985.1 GGDEF domain-containing protein [Modicisalibacter sp. MOD 31.J]